MSVKRCVHSVSDILGGSPRRCKRDAQKGNTLCWQHLESHKSPKTSPKTVKTPQKSPKSAPRKVQFSNKVSIKKISPRNKKVKGGIAWAEPVTPLQAECVSSVMDVYGIWDREDLEKAQGLTNRDKRLIKTCLRIMEGDSPSNEYKKELLAFSSNRERERDIYRMNTINRENSW
jgi:hypothetical protein